MEASGEKGTSEMARRRTRTCTEEEKAKRNEAAGEVDWMALPDDAALLVFARLSYRDRANMAAACRAWRALGLSPCLWSELDLRAYRFDADVASSLASRCGSLRRLWLWGEEAAEAVPLLRAHNLRELILDDCRDITDTTLAVLAAGHVALETLQVAARFELLELVSSNALRSIALCCSRLRRLRLIGVLDADAGAIGALARYCPLLEDVAFLHFRAVDEAALSSIHSLRFLSLAGCSKLEWTTASASLAQLPSLTAVDVSFTHVSPSAISHLISYSQTLKLICALGCESIDEQQDLNPSAFSNSRSKLVLTVRTRILKAIASLFPGKAVKEHEVFNEINWRDKDKALGDTMGWLEWILSRSLQSLSMDPGNGDMYEFWLQRGTSMVLSFLKSSQEDVQEQAADAFQAFETIDAAMFNVLVRDGCIVPVLLDLARCSKESTQLAATEAIDYLLWVADGMAVKVVADEGGIAVFINLAKSTNRLVANNVAAVLGELSRHKEHKAAIAASGGIKALVDLVFRWPVGSDTLLENAAGALADLSSDDKCGLEIVKANGVHALVTLFQSCKLEGLQDVIDKHTEIQKEAARALANLVMCKDSINVAVRQEAVALDALVQIACSQHEGVCPSMSEE